MPCRSAQLVNRLSDTTFGVFILHTRQKQPAQHNLAFLIYLPESVAISLSTHVKSHGSTSSSAATRACKCAGQRQAQRWQEKVEDTSIAVF